jgi:hypothetical protein
MFIFPWPKRASHVPKVITNADGRCNAISVADHKRLCDGVGMKNNTTENLTEFGRVCRDFPDGRVVVVTAADGRTFDAVSDGQGVAWVHGHAWGHPAAGVISTEVLNAARSAEVAASWA